MDLIIIIFSTLIIGLSLFMLRREKFGITKMQEYSILIACRNEAKQLPYLFVALDRLDYPKNKYEIIIVDDASHDRSPILLENYAANSTNTTVFYLKNKDSLYKGKKAALKLAAEHAKFDIFLMTDADCQPYPNWLKSINNFITPKIGMVIGNYHELNSPRLREFADKLTASFYGISVAAGLPYSCSGMNLLIRKEAFMDVGGYEKIKHYLAGDDKHLLNLIRQTKWKIVYNPEKIMASTSENDLKSNHNQRLRKYGKFASSRNSIKMISILFGLLYLYLPYTVIFRHDYLSLIFYFIALLFFWIINMYKHQIRFKIVDYLILLFYPYFLMFYIIAGMMSKWEWKGQQK